VRVTPPATGLEWTTMDHSAYIKRFYAIVCVGAGVLLALVWVLLKSGLSPRGFAVAVLMWWVAMFASIFVLLRSRQRGAKDFRDKQISDGVSTAALDRDQCVKNIRSMKRLIAMFAVFLGYGLLSTQGMPVLPRIVGAAVDVFILAVCAQLLFRSRKRLQELDAGTGDEETSN